jgi:hypothetical protein
MVDGLRRSRRNSTSSGVAGWQVQVDIDASGSPVTIDEYLDLVDLSAL